MGTEPLIIALDYDGTYTADPELWRGFIHTALGRGHIVIIATMRYDTETLDIDTFVTSRAEIIFTGRKAKKPFLSSLGINPDIWIDDNPNWLYEDTI